eukprot:scaffold137031_cov341-Phaeocystis_antarctica.AAC.1
MVSTPTDASQPRHTCRRHAPATPPRRSPAVRMAPLKPTALTHPAHAPPSAAAASKKLYTFKPSATAGNTSGAFKKAAFKKQKALFSIARAKHQKGPLAGSFTNHIISFLRGANLDNDKLRAALTPFLLGERLKWNNDQVAFS